MKLLASLAFGTATVLAATFGLAQPALAQGDDDVAIGLKVGPLCVGLCINGGGGHREGRYRGGDDECYDYDCDGTGFYSHREDYYHQRYDRRDSDDEYAEYRDDGYAGYRRHHQHHHHHDSDDDE